MQFQYLCLQENQTTGQSDQSIKSKNGETEMVTQYLLRGRLHINNTTNLELYRNYIKLSKKNDMWFQNMKFIIIRLDSFDHSRQTTPPPTTPEVTRPPTWGESPELPPKQGECSSKW